MNNPLTINVGGICYETTRSTLRAAPFFAALFDHTSEDSPVQCSSTRDKHGNMFIDRNGTIFAEVLEFLRRGEIVHSSPDGRAILSSELKASMALDAELRFYGLDPPRAVTQQVSVQTCVDKDAASRGGEGSNKLRNMTVIVTGPKEVLQYLDIHSHKIKKISKFAFRALSSFQYRLELESYMAGVQHDLLTMGFVAVPALKGDGQHTFERVVRDNAACSDVVGEVET